MGVNKHIVRDRAGFMGFHPYLVGSPTVVLGNGSEDDVLNVVMYKLRLLEVVHCSPLCSLYTWGVSLLFVLVSLMKLRLFFNSLTGGLDLLHGANLFGHATLKKNLLVLDLDYLYNNSSFVFVLYFDFKSEYVKWYARLRHISQERMSRLAKDGLLD